MSDLATIHRDIGALQASVDHMAEESGRARDRDRELFTRLDELRNAQVVAAQQLIGLVEQHGKVEARLKSVEDGVSDYRSMKRAGVAIWTGSVAVAGFIGWVSQHISGWLHRT